MREQIFQKTKLYKKHILIIFMKKEGKDNHPSLLVPTKLGQRAADALTKWAGSWVFILLFLGILVLWIIVNSYWILFGRTWDPFPFILLNLALSCLAAIQAPIILMSQNRSNQKDRLRAEYDYAVNRKAEKEIGQIQKQLDKIDKRLSRK